MLLVKTQNYSSDRDSLERPPVGDVEEGAEAGVSRHAPLGRRRSCFFGGVRSPDLRAWNVD